MRQTFLTILGSMLIVVSAAQVPGAGEPRHMRQSDRSLTAARFQGPQYSPYMQSYAEFGLRVPGPAMRAYLDGAGTISAPAGH